MRRQLECAIRIFLLLLFTHLLPSAPIKAAASAHLAFIDATDQQIYITDVDGAELKRLTMDTATKSDIKWSPDGGWLAFRADEEAELRILDVQTGATQRIAIQVKFFEWLPIGTSLLYSVAVNGRAGDETNGVWSLDVATGQQQRLIQRTPDLFAVSPDGAKLAVAYMVAGHGPEASFAGVDLYVHDSTDTEEQRAFATVECYTCRALLWSPSGSQLALIDYQRVYIATVTEVIKLNLIVSAQHEGAYFSERRPYQLDPRRAVWLSNAPTLAYYDQMALTQLTFSPVLPIQIERLFREQEMKAYFAWSPTTDGFAYRHVHADRPDCQDAWWQNDACLSLEVCPSKDGIYSGGCVRFNRQIGASNAAMGQPASYPLWSPDGSYLSWLQPQGIAIIEMATLAQEVEDGTFSLAPIRADQRITEMAWQPQQP